MLLFQGLLVQVERMHSGERHAAAAVLALQVCAVWVEVGAAFAQTTAAPSPLTLLQYTDTHCCGCRLICSALHML